MSLDGTSGSRAARLTAVNSLCRVACFERQDSESGDHHVQEQRSCGRLRRETADCKSHRGGSFGSPLIYPNFALQNIMEATLEAERKAAEDSSSIGRLELFKGKNGIRLLISLWPKMMQQVRDEKCTLTRTTELRVFLLSSSV